MKKLSMEELHRASVEEFSNMEKLPVVVILDNVRSALNVGSFFRTCDTFAIRTLVLTGISATPPNREINKTAIGSTESVQWQYFEHIMDAINYFKKEGYKIIGVEQTDQSQRLQDFTLTDTKAALVFGNEVNGLSESILPLLDGCIEIPQVGTKHSLNVSVCGGIVLWEVFRKFHDIV